VPITFQACGLEQVLGRGHQVSNLTTSRLLVFVSRHYIYYREAKIHSVQINKRCSSTIHIDTGSIDALYQKIEKTCSSRHQLLRPCIKYIFDMSLTKMLESKERKSLWVPH